MSPLVLCSLTIVITLLVSGIAKARDRSSTATAIVNLKLDKWLALKPVSLILPWAEIALACWILVAAGPAGTLGALAALILFAAYWIVIARAVITGNTASCNCFGSDSQAPISGYTLARNTALLAAAVANLLANQAAEKSPLGMLYSASKQDWLWLLAAGLSALTLWCLYRSELLAHKNPPAQGITQNYQQNQSEDEQAEYLRLPIPYAALQKAGNQQNISLRELAQQQARILFWLSPDCSSCQAVIDRIEGWQQKLPALKLNPVLAQPYQLPQLNLAADIEVLLDQNHRSQTVFGHGTPMAVGLGSDGLLAGGPVLGAAAVLNFMDELLKEFDAA